MIDIADAALFFGVGLAVFMLASSARRRIPSGRLGRLALVPVTLGLLLAITLMLFFGDRIVALIRSAIAGALTPFRPILGPFLLAACLGLAAAFGELALVVFPQRYAERLERRGLADPIKRRRVGLSSWLLLSLLSVGSLVGAQVGESRTVVSRRLDLVGTHVLPGPPMDYEAVDETSGYLTVATGEVYLVRLPQEPDGEATYEQVAQDLRFPRGIAIGDGVMYVAEVGDLACEDEYPTCFGFTAEREKEIIEASSGTLYAFDIADDLSLVNRREVISGLPIVSSEHALNDVEIGPDGAVYVSIGGVDWMWEVPDQVATLNHPKVQFLGTILRLDPSTLEVTIHASGLRNVYGFDFDPTGRILAADNDGWTTLGWRPEMIVAIRGGEDFGYPGNSGAGVTGQGTPHVWQLTRTGSTAVQWLDRGPWSPGLLVGGHDSLTYTAMGTSGDYVFVTSRQDAEVDVLDVTGFVTVVEQMESGRLVVGVTGIYGGTPNQLLVIDPLES